MNRLPEALVKRLLEMRKRHHLPARIRPQAQAFLERVLGAMFPHLAETAGCSQEAVVADLAYIREQLEGLERSIAALSPDMPKGLVDNFFNTLTSVHESLVHDAEAIYEGDPAARGVDEVILTYPGFRAIAVFRLAHELHVLGFPLLPRLLTEIAHEKTGVDIHPGATIGQRFCIDHGTGIVVGETTNIGNNVKLYQGVTLGALTVEKSLAGNKRHPTLEDEVVVYAGATILGGNTVVGQGSIVAGNAFVTSSVPANSVVTRQNEVRLRRGPGGALDLDFVI